METVKVLWTILLVPAVWGVGGLCLRGRLGTPNHTKPQLPF